MIQEILRSPLIQLQPFLPGLIDKPVDDGALFISDNMETEEVWKDIPGYEGHYKASSHGNIRSYKPCSLNNNSYKLLKVLRYSNGYCFITLCKEGLKKSFILHRLIASVFIPNALNLPEINHKDEDKTNNRVDNLEWCTHKYNINFGTSLSRRTKTVLLNKTYSGSHNGRAKLTNEIVLEIYNSSLSGECLSKIYGIHKSTACNIKSKRSWRFLLCNI